MVPKTLLLLWLLIVSACQGQETLPYLAEEEQCVGLLGGTNVTVIFTANPGSNHGGVGENYYLRQHLENAQNVTFPACFDAVQGTLYSSPVALVTTGEGPMVAELCVFQTLSCSKYIHEVLFFGTAGFSPRLGGILNPPESCTPPEDQGTLVRFGDICITNHAINWDCQGNPWASTAANWPNECSLAGNPNAPFEDVSEDGSYASYRGWSCRVQDPGQASESLADELFAARDELRMNVPPVGVQEYSQWFWGNTTAAINRTWSIDPAGTPTIFNRSQCAEVDTIFWWTGVPWDTQARGFVSYATGLGAPANTTLAASAMEGIGFLGALRLAQNITGIFIPYAIVRSSSDYTVNIPVYQAPNGTWLPGDPISLPSSLESGGAPVTVYAIQTGNDLILSMFRNREKTIAMTSDHHGTMISKHLQAVVMMIATIIITL